MFSKTSLDKESGLGHDGVSTEVLEPLPLISALLWRVGQMFKCESSHRILIFLAELCFQSKLKTTGVAGLSVNDQIPCKQSHPQAFISLSSSEFCYPFGNCSFIWSGGPPSEPEPFVWLKWVPLYWNQPFCRFLGPNSNWFQNSSKLKKS